MLLQTNSYVVPKDRRSEHARLLRRFRQTLARLGCENFEVYEQVGANWSSGEPTGRYVQIMRFRDRRHQLAVQAAERNDPSAQALIAEFCQLINFPYQQQHGFFAVGFYSSVLPVAPVRHAAPPPEEPLVTPPMPGDVVEAVAGEVVGEETAAALETEATPFQSEQPLSESAAATAWTADGGEPAVAGNEENSSTEVEHSTIEEEHSSKEVAEAMIADEPAHVPGAAAPEHTHLHAAPETEPVGSEALGTDAGATADDSSENYGLNLLSEPAESAAEHEQPFMAPHHEAQEAAPAPVAESTGNGKYAHEPEPARHAPPAQAEHHEETLADLLDDHFGEPVDLPEEPEHAEEHEPSGSGIGEVLDALSDDDLDEALPAELIDEPEELSPHAPHAHEHGSPTREDERFRH